MVNSFLITLLLYGRSIRHYLKLFFACDCDSSDHPVSVVVVVVVVVAVNLFVFSTSLESLHGFASNFVWTILRGTPTKFVKIDFNLRSSLNTFSTSLKPLHRN